MGAGSKILSVILRLGELCSAIIVTALLGRFFYLIQLAPHESLDGRLIYAQVISCLQILFSIILILPYKYSFYAWPVDVILFICSIVAFGLLANLSSSCSSHWYWNYWGYYWGRYWTVAPRIRVTSGTINHAGCGTWKTILAFLFLGSLAWMVSAFLGLFNFLRIRKDRETHIARTMKEKATRKMSRTPDPEQVAVTSSQE